MQAFQAASTILIGGAVMSVLLGLIMLGKTRDIRLFVVAAVVALVLMSIGVSALPTDQEVCIQANHSWVLVKDSAGKVIGRECRTKDSTPSTAPSN